MKRNKLGGLLLFAVLMAGCAMQQDILVVDDRLALLERRYSDLEQRQVDLKNRLLEAEKTRTRLESALQDLGKNRDVKEVDLRGQFAGLNSEVNAIRKEIQALRGSIEETDFQLKQKLSGPENEKGREAAEIAVSNRNRIARIESYLNLEKGGKPGVAPAAPVRPEASRPEVKANPEEESYNRAKQAMDKGDLETARTGFQEFLAKFPKSGNADNAQFWIGEVYYREKWYEKAILEYQKVIEKYPKGNKAPAALLKQGFAFLNLGDKSNARLILKELIKKYPDSNEGKIAAQKLKEIN